MAAIISDKFRIFNAKQFLSSLGDDSFGDQANLIAGSESERSRMYFFVGRPQKWDTYLEIYSKSSTSFQVGEEVTVGGGTTFRATVRAVAEDTLILFNVSPQFTSVPPRNSTLTGSTSGATAKTGVYRYATEEIPPMPLDNQREKTIIYDEIIAAKRITTAYARPVIRRYNWDVVANPKYDMWKPDYSATPGGGVQVGKQTATLQDNIANAKFYVINSRYEVFKCLYNGEDLTAGGGNATEEPITTGVNFSAATGIYKETAGARYVWKYMYTIPTDDVLKFLSTDFMPIVLPSDQSRQDTEEIAADAPNAIDVVIIEDAGSNLPVSQTLYTSIKGDGTGGIVEFATNNSGAITSATIKARGSGYTYANVLLGNGNLFSNEDLTTSVPTGATAKGSLEVILPPLGGHGSDFEQELNAKRVMTNIRLTYAEGSGDFPIDNDFRRIGILKDPYQRGTTNFLTQETASGLKAIKINGATADFIPDERIQQTVTGGTAFGTVVSWTLDNPDAGTGNGVLKYIQTVETDMSNGIVRNFVSGAAIVEGQLSGADGTVDTTYDTGGSVLPLLGLSFTDGLALPEIENNSGNFIYIENRRLITRAPDQIEDIKLVIEF
jgi:hypothetical protein